MKKVCKSKSSDVAEYARKFPTGHWSFLGHGFEEKWYAALGHDSDGLWNKVADEMFTTYPKAGNWRAEPTLLLRVIVSVTQFSVYGAVAGWRQDLARQIEAHSPPSEGHKLRTWRMIPRLKSHQSTSRTSPNHQFGFLEHKETGSGNTKGNSKLFQMTFN